MPRLELTARFSPLACTGLVVLATVGMSNAAIIIPISQVRSVNAGASGSFTPVNQTITATGFGPFDAVASVSTGVTDNGQISLSASQHSSIFSNFISCNGELRIVSQGFNGTTRQESLFNLTFHVDTATPYSMAVFLLDGSVPSNSRLGLGLFVAGSITEFDFLDYPFTQFRTGQLAPGNYRLTSTVDGFDSPSNFGFSWYFSLPAPSTAPILGAGLLLAARRRRGNSHPLATFTY